MTIGVYKINPETGTRTDVRPKQSVRPVEQPDLSTKWPICTCRRCLKPDGRHSDPESARALDAE
jgi:hypothetical protein